MNSSVTNQQKTNSSSPPRLLDHLPRINNSSEHEDDEYDHEELFRIASPGRHVFTLADSAAMTTTRFQPPLGTSPHISSETAHDDHDHHNEYSSFGLMNSSFDTLSDAGRLFGVVAGGWEDDASKNQCCSSKTATATTMSNENGRTRHHPQKLIQSSSSSTHAAATGFTNANDTASSVRRGSQFLSESPMMGDISPIKVVYTSSTSFQDGKNEPHNQEMVMESKFYTFDTLKNTSVVPADWMQEAANHNHDGYRGRSNPIYVIKASRKAFHSVKYLLPCLRSNASCPVNVSDYGSIRQYKERKDGDATLTSEWIIATRRVESAICAFGGTLNSNQNKQTWSIFRHKGEEIDIRHNYEQSLPDRYRINGSNVSWDVEENPPIHLSSSVSSHEGGYFGQKSNLFSSNTGVKATHSDNESLCLSETSETRGVSEDKQSEASRMKYKCKLCGQLKQNHNCPYQQPLQRSIGVTVYPAVNSYTAEEPGQISKTLTTMNNFVSYYSDQSGPPAGSVSRQRSGSLYAAHPSAVTPDTPRGASLFHSPQSSLSAHSSEDANINPVLTNHGAIISSRGVKRSHHQFLGYKSSPFVPSVMLRPEQYRAVTPLKTESAKSEQDSPTTTSTTYQYAAIPLSFSERKRLCDTLFFLSKEIPTLTSDCAAALRDARQNKEWDLAVAELLTQVVVGLYCSETDTRLDGLHQYLLGLCISC